jgi:mannose-6-phosphate isomerase-like protein (cupin superfamily)
LNADRAPQLKAVVRRNLDITALREDHPQVPKQSFAKKKLPKKRSYPAPDGSEIRLLLEVAGGGLAHCKLPAGGVSRAVRHKTVEEIWYFISGRGQVWRKRRGQEQVVIVYPELCLTIPSGTHFQFRNIGDEPLCFLIATIPRWPGKQEAEPVRGRWEKDGD